MPTCRKCPRDAYKIFKNHFIDFKESKCRSAKKRVGIECQVMEPSSYYSKDLEDHEASNLDNMQETQI